MSAVGASGPLFAPGSAFAQCHASTVAAVPGGLEAAWFAGEAEGHPGTAIWGASFRAGAWSAPRVRFKVSGEAHWNPVLFAAPDGILHLWFKTGRDCAIWRSWHAESSDGGATWGVATTFLPDDALARGPVRCQPVVAADGAWLAGGSDERQGAWWPFIERSADGGRTWAATPISVGTEAKGAIQPTLWVSADGAAHCLLRTGGGRIWRSDSADGGLTWAPAYATDLPNNHSGVAVARADDGRLLLLWNPVEKPWGPRTPLRLSQSRDDGRTWTTVRDLASGEGEFSYPALVVHEDEVIATWTDRRATIACWQGSVADCVDTAAGAAQ